MTMIGGNLNMDSLVVRNRGVAAIKGTAAANVCDTITVTGEDSLLELSETAVLKAGIITITDNGAFWIFDSPTLSECDGAAIGMLLTTESAVLEIHDPAEIHAHNLTFKYRAGTTDRPSFFAVDGTRVILTGSLILTAPVDGTGLGNTEFVFRDNALDKRIFTCSEDKGCTLDGFVANNAIKKLRFDDEGMYLEITETAPDRKACYIEDIILADNSTIMVPDGLRLYYKRLTLPPGASIVGYACQVDEPVTHQLTTDVAPFEGGVLTCVPNPVPDGETSVCTVIPAEHYQVRTFGGDCGGVENGNVFTTDPITAPCTVSVTLFRTYWLTVNQGGGDGKYEAGEVVNIAADPPLEGQTFDKWIGDTAHVANVSAPNTTVTMPEADVSVTAAYTDLPPELFTLTEVNGSGGGLYPEGATVGISAAAAAQGKVFEKWTGDTAFVGNVSNPETTVTMPAADVTVTATYKVQQIVYVSADGTCNGNEPCYATLSEAVSAAEDKALIKVAGDMAGNTVMDPAGTLYIEFGYDAEFTSNVGGVTEVQGIFTVKDETIIRSGTIKGK